MRHSFVILLTGFLFAAEAASGQGTVQFVWHGNSNFFQASFIVTDAEIQGAPIGSPEFTNSVSVSSPSGILYNSKDDTQLLGSVNPWAFSLTFINFSYGTEIFVRGGEPPRGAMAGTIEERQISGSDIYFETGHWTYSQIPEPAVSGLWSVGILFFFGRRRRSGS